MSNEIKRNLLLFSLIFVVAVLLVRPALAAVTAEFVLSPEEQAVSAGEDLTIKFEMETGAGNKVNSYQLILEYPKDKLEFQSIDNSGSPFNMALQAEGGDGEVRIARGSVEALTGKVLVGEVNFKAKGAADANMVNVSTESVIVGQDNQNILIGSTYQNTPGADSSGAQSTNFFAQILNQISAFFKSFFK